MPHLLGPELFDQSKLPSLANFDCGSSKFGKIATDWIKCTNSQDCALSSMANKGTQVFLYYQDNGALVGYGSLGTTTRTVGKVIQSWSIIPHVGVDSRYHGYPPGVDRNERFAALIMLDLMARAKDRGTPKLLLYVHIENHAARRLYERLGFKPIGLPNSEQYQKMAVLNA